MRVLIVSDTHRRDDLLGDVLEAAGGIDMLVHAGDIEGSEALYRRVMCERNGDFHGVAGNNDFFTDLPQEEIFCIGTHRVYLTHGHRHRVSAMGDVLLRDEARSRDADILIYGHTHKPSILRESGLLILNPGSLAYPRQPGRRPSYILLEARNDKDMTAEIRFM